MSPLPHSQVQATRGERITCEQDLGFEDRVVWAQMPAPQDVGVGEPELVTGFCKPPSPACAGLLSRLNSLTFTQHSIDVIVPGLLTDFYPETELLSF